jgi:hypothetical protein
VFQCVRLHAKNTKFLMMIGTVPDDPGVPIDLFRPHVGGSGDRSMWREVCDAVRIGR